jgi:hypothetical protein
MGDEIHLTGDENQKAVFKNRFTRNETHLTGDEKNLLHVFFIHTPEK